MTCHPQHLRLVSIKMMRDNKGWQGCRGKKKKPPVHCGWCCKWAQPIRKTVQSFFPKYLKTELPYNSAILLLGIYLSQLCIASSKCPMLAFCTDFRQNRFIKLPFSDNEISLPNRQSQLFSLPVVLLDDGIMMEVHGGAETTWYDRQQALHCEKWISPWEKTTIYSFQREHPSDLIAFYWAQLFSFLLLNPSTQKSSFNDMSL